MIVIVIDFNNAKVKVVSHVTNSLHNKRKSATLGCSSYIIMIYYNGNYVQFGVEGVKEILHTCSHVDILSHSDRCSAR